MSSKFFFFGFLDSLLICMTDYSSLVLTSHFSSSVHCSKLSCVVRLMVVPVFCAVSLGLFPPSDVHICAYSTTFTINERRFDAEYERILLFTGPAQLFEFELLRSCFELSSKLNGRNAFDRVIIFIENRKHPVQHDSGKHGSRFLN